MFFLQFYSKNLKKARKKPLFSTGQLESKIFEIILKNIEKHGIKTKFSICCMLFIENNYIRAEPEERNHFFRERVLILERGNINAEKHSTYPMPTVWQRQAHGCSEPCKCGKTTAIRTRRNGFSSVPSAAIKLALPHL